MGDASSSRSAAPTMTLLEVPAGRDRDQAGASSRPARAPAPRRRRAVPVRVLDGRLRRLPQLRGGVRRAERPAGRDRRGGGSARWRAGPSWTARRFHLSMWLQPLPRAAVPRGCPTNAYEKLPNGVVAHQADDCIGCQYCTWGCPYYVPPSSSPTGGSSPSATCASPGWRTGVAPACVDACPTHAITVEKVVIADWRRFHAEADAARAAVGRADPVDDPDRAAGRGAHRHLRGERLEPPARAPPLAPRVADPGEPDRGGGQPRGDDRRAPLRGRRPGRPGHGRRPAAPGPAGHGVEGPAQPAAVVAEPGGGGPVAPTPGWPVLPCWRRRWPGGRRGRGRRRVRAGPPVRGAGAAGVEHRADAGAVLRHRDGHRSAADRAAGLGRRRPGRGPGRDGGELAAAGPAGRPAVVGLGPAGAALVPVVDGGPLALWPSPPRRWPPCWRRSPWSWPWPASSSAGGCSSSPSSPSTCPACSGGASTPATGDAGVPRPRRPSRRGLGGPPMTVLAGVPATRSRRADTLGVGPRWRVATPTSIDDPVFGPISATRALERWVRTTCGYCSVGCGILLGVRGGKAVAVAGRPRPPGEPGPAVPQGALRAPHHRRPRAAHRAPMVDGAAPDVGRRPRPDGPGLHGGCSTSTAPTPSPSSPPASW